MFWHVAKREIAVRRDMSLKVSKEEERREKTKKTWLLSLGGVNG
jgi:hypothetical protein